MGGGETERDRKRYEVDTHRRRISEWRVAAALCAAALAIAEDALADPALSPDMRALFDAHAAAARARLARAEEDLLIAETGVGPARALPTPPAPAGPDAGGAGRTTVFDFGPDHWLSREPGDA